MISGKTELVGLFGMPLGHTMSPRMHNQVFNDAGIDLVYIPLPCTLENIGSAVSALRIFPFKGVNVTIPYKEAVIPYLDHVSDISRLIGAVNTITVKDGKLFGTTTDPLGFKRGLAKAGVSLMGQKVAILGSGGTARTIAFALCMDAEVSAVTLFARNTLRLGELAQEINQGTNFPIKTDILSNFSDVSNDYTIIIQATSVGMYPNNHATPIDLNALHAHHIVCDVIYNPLETLLMQKAKALGCKVVGGLPMLIYQGMASVELWLGKAPDESLYFKALSL